MNDPLDDVLQRYFSDVARTDDRLVDTPARVVMRRGARRKARRRTGVMAGTLAVGTLASVLTVNALTRGPDSKVTTFDNDDTGNGEPVTTDGPSLTTSPLVWNPVIVGSAEAIAGIGSVVADPSGGFYALSTEPGRRQPQEGVLTPTVYHSTDGIHWQAQGTSSPRFGWLVSAGSGRLYSVGTQAATAPVVADRDPGVAVLTSSDDGGVNWSSIELPLDLQGVRTLPEIRGVELTASVAAGTDGTVVAAVVRGSLDTSAYLPDGVDPMAMDWWADPAGPTQYELVPTDCGQGGSPPAVDVAVYMSEDGACSTRGQIVRSYTWEDFGVSAQSLQAQRGELHVLLAGEGEAFAEQVLPAPPQGWTVQMVHSAVAAGHYVVTVQLSKGMGADGSQQTTATLVYMSEDGRSWTSSDVPDLSVASIGALADGTVVVSGWSTRGTAAIATLRDGSWRVTELGSLPLPEGVIAETASAPAVGALGVAVIVRVGEPLDPSALDKSAPATAPGATTPGPYRTQFGDVVDASNLRSVLLFSEDGITWSATDLSDMTSDPTLASLGNAVTVTEHNVLISGRAAQPSDDPSAPLPDQTILVGTLAS